MLLVFIFGPGGSILSPQYTSRTNLLITVLVIAILVALPLNAIIGLYVVIDGQTLYRMDWFFYKTSVAISDVETVSYPTTFIFGRSNRTLVIFAKTGGSYKQITMSFPAFTKDTLRRVIDELQKRK